MHILLYFTFELLTHVCFYFIVFSDFSTHRLSLIHYEEFKFNLLLDFQFNNNEHSGITIKVLF